MASKSRVFSSSRPYKRHLVRGSGGVQAEISDLRTDIEAAFVAFEAEGQLAPFKVDVVDPTVNDDSTAGYTIYSRWVNTTPPRREFVCLDATPGAADWKETTGVLGGGAVASVFGRTGNVVSASGDYTASQVTNDSGVAGAFVSDALDTLEAAIPPVAPVDSIFGRTGVIVALVGDYTASQVTNTSGVAGAQVSSALDTLNSDKVPNARTVTAGAGLAGGGDLSANRTIDVVAHPDGSISVSPTNIRVGVLASDTQHGNRGGGGLHATATGVSNGFMSFMDKSKLDGIQAGAQANTVATVFGRTGSIIATLGDYTASLIANTSGVPGATVAAALDALEASQVPSSRAINAGAGLTGGGDLSTNRTLNVANLDGSIAVSADAISVGILANDTQHGIRGGGTQHSVATVFEAGFMSPADKIKLDSLGAGVIGVWQEPVIDKDLSAPPGSPSVDDRYIVASGGSGDWSGQDDNIASWNGSVWVFVTPEEGFTTYILDEATWYRFESGSWVIVSGGGGAVASVFGRTGAVVAQVGDYTHAQIGSIGEDDHHNRQHGLGSGADHTSATLAELNALVSDATLDDSGDSRPPSGAASGQLGGTYPGPDVRGIRETSGPTLLTLGAIADGQTLVRSGATIIGAAPGGAPVDSVFGRTGVVVAQIGDYTHAQIGSVGEDDHHNRLHGLGSVLDHGAATLAQLNALVSDATLDDALNPRPPSGAAGGQLGDTYPNPDVRGIRETSGPTLLTVGSIADGEYLTRSGSALVGATPPGAGDVVGPASATDNAVARFDTATGKLIQNSGVLIDDSDNITGVTTLNGVTVESHAARHENGGADEISVSGLAGLLADPQTPLSHAATHSDGGADEISVENLATASGNTAHVLKPNGVGGLVMALLAVTDLPLHAARHENGGSDEIDVTGLSGVLADPQTPATHASSHNDGGSDELGVQNLAASSTDTSERLRPDGSGGLEWVPAGDLSDASAGSSTTSGTTFLTKASVTIPAEDGTFIIEASALISHSNATGNPGARLQNITDAGTLGRVWESEMADSDNVLSVTLRWVFAQTAVAGAKTIGLQYALVSGTGTMTISNAVITARRAVS